MLVVILPLLFFHSISSSYIPVITTSYGSIRGYDYTNQAGFTSHIFKKLPFASAPLDDLRFKKPIPPQKWNTTIDGTFFGPACSQKTIMYKDPVNGVSEDCLHINVYTSEQCIQKSCPVLFIIHGGLGIYESPMKFPDEVLTTNFVSQGIVVVTTAYRVSAFGIFALGDENVLPANMALHDIHRALQFTRDEIHAFGGDKEQMTLIGHSTGGQMALVFAFSPAISPPGIPRLFHSVISMSGPMAFEAEEKQVERSHKVAKKLNCSGSAREIIECMKKKTTEEILTAAYKTQGPNIFNEEGLIGLVLAGELFPMRSVRGFIDDEEPLRLMIGTTMLETNNPQEPNKVNQVIGIVNDEECYAKYLADRASGAFVPGHGTEAQELFMTAVTYAKKQAEIGGEVYLYQYEYPEHAVHTDDAFFVLGFHPYEKDSNEEWLSRVYPRYFANFAKGERPAPDWYMTKPNLMNYYAVNYNESSGVNPHMKFGYHDDISKYYADLENYDQKLTEMKQKILNAPVQYH